MLKALLKNFVVRACGPHIQQTLRRFYLTRQIVNSQSFREPEMQTLKTLVSRGDCVADIGANVGVYTKELSLLVGSQGKVYSFEPVSENYAVLRNVIRTARLHNVQAFHIALGSDSKQARIVIPDLGGFAGYYWAHFAQPGDSGRFELVNVQTLDGLAGEQTLQQLDFIKCDVEGSELEVLHGGAELIQRWKPGWLMEVSQKTSTEVFNFFCEKLGYYAYVYNGGLRQTTGYRDKEYSNYFFLHHSSAVWRRAQALIVP